MGITPAQMLGDPGFLTSRLSDLTSQVLQVRRSAPLWTIYISVDEATTLRERQPPPPFSTKGSAGGETYIALGAIACFFLIGLHNCVFGAVCHSVCGGRHGIEMHHKELGALVRLPMYMAQPGD